MGTEDSKFVDGEWKFLVKSETVPFVPLPLLSPYSPVVPESISNVEFALTLTPPLIGAATNHTLEFKVGGSTPQEKTLDFNANIMGTPLTGKLLYKGHGSGQKERAQLKATITDGVETLVDLSGQLDGPFMAWTRMRLKNHKSKTGLYKIQREDEKITVEVGQRQYGGIYKLLLWPRAYKIQAFDNNALMYSYQFNKEVDMNPDTYELTLTSEMALNPSSMLFQLLPYYNISSFQQGSSKFKIFIEKNNRNFILPKFRLELEVDRDGVRVVDVRGNTVASPNSFSASIPGLFGLIGISENPATLTIDHQSSSAQRSLVVETNLVGGMRFDASETPSVITQGRIIEVEATKSGTRMWKYFGVTEKKNKNALLNKFYVNAKVEKDSITVADVMISTTTSPSRRTYSVERSCSSC